MNNADIHKQRIVKRAVRMLLRAARLLSTPVLEAPANLSPWPPQDPRAIRLASLWRTQAALSLAAAAMSRLGARAPEAQSRFTRENRLPDQHALATLARFVRRYLDPESERLVSIVAGTTPQTLLRSYGMRTWFEVEEMLAANARHLEKVGVRFIELAGESSDDSSRDYPLTPRDRRVSYTICTKDHATGQVGCEETDENTFWTVVIVVVLGGVIGWTGGNAGDWFNEMDDDEARIEINNSSCEEIVAKPDAHWIDRFDAMMDGPTLDDDETAMLKVLHCLPCSRVQTLVSHYGTNNLMDEFNGSAWDSLLVRLQACALVRFSDWDDGVTRWFVSHTPTSKLANLSINDIVILRKNLLDGAGGDDNEDALIRLIGCQHPCKVVKILLAHIISDDLDSGVDGDVWEALCSSLVKHAQQRLENRGW